MNNAKRNQSRFGIVLSGALLAAAAFAVPGFFQNQKEAEAVETYYPAIPMAAAPSAPEASSSTGSTTLYIQNKEAVAGNVYVTFYQDSGASIDLTSCLVGTAGVTNTIPASGNLTLDYATCGSLASGSRGSSVVSSDVDVAVVDSNVYQTNKASGSYKGISSGSSTLTFPQVLKNWVGKQESRVVIQNTTSITCTVSLGLYQSGSSSPVNSTTVQIPAFSSHIWDSMSDSLFASPPLPSQYLGSATATTSGGCLMAGEVDTRRNALGMGSTQELSQTLYNYVAFGSGAKTVYLPQVRRAHGQFLATTGIQIANLENLSATVVMTFSPSIAGLGGGTVTESVPALSSINYWQGSLLKPPTNVMSATGWLGSVKITSNRDIAVVVNDAFDANSGSHTSNAMYSGLFPSDGQSRLYAPYIRWNYQNASSIFRTGLQIQNIGQTPTNVRIDFVSTNPAAVLNPSGNAYDEYWLLPEQSVNFYPAKYKRDATLFLPNEFIGYAIISATPITGSTSIDVNGKLGAIINTASFTTQSASSYDNEMYPGIGP